MEEIKKSCLNHKAEIYISIMYEKVEYILCNKLSESWSHEIVNEAPSTSTPLIVTIY